MLYMIKYQVNDTDRRVMARFGVLMNDQKVVAQLFLFLVMFLKEIYISRTWQVGNSKYYFIINWAFGQIPMQSCLVSWVVACCLNLRPRQGISLPPKSYYLTTLRLATLQKTQRERNEQVQDSKPSLYVSCLICI